jgi:DNA-binding response OmpR family regulator
MNKKILIIEDDVFLGEVLLKKFQNAGYESALSARGAEGLSLAREMKPDIILLDILLPEMNGYEILEAKLADSSIAGIPVIVISNSGQPVEISRLFELGVKDYLIKAQFDPEEILAKVRTELGEDPFFGGKPSSVSSREKTNSPEKILPGKKILLVEDEVFLSEIIFRKLSSFGASVFRADDGEDALQVLLRETPDIILLDIVMPGMDGFELLEKLKASEKTAAIPVILFSNLEQQSDVERGKKLGAAGFIVKVSMTPDEVAEKLSEVLASTPSAA